MSQIWKMETRYIVKTSLLYCGLSAAFSLVGIFIAQKGPLENPIGSLTINEVVGHFLWGLIVGAVTLSLRYTIIAGVFAVLIDSDHLIAFTHIDALFRMSHSISFGIISLVVLMILTRTKDWRLGAIAFAAVLSHVSFDIFAGDPRFPIFAPFYNSQISFSHIDWLYFEVAAIVIVGVVSILARRKVQDIVKI
jgi:hypothetical protein